MKPLSILDWYHILRMQYQLTIFRSIRYALWLARLAERLVRPLLQKSQRNRFLSRWPCTAFQKQREQHHANRAYRLART